MKTMPKMAGLQRRNLTYFVRVRVPKDVQAHFKCKEINRTLDTRDYNTAAKRIHAVRDGIEAEFEKARKTNKAKTSGLDMLASYTEHQLTGLVVKWFGDIKGKEEKRHIKYTGQWTEARLRDYPASPTRNTPKSGCFYICQLKLTADAATLKFD